MALCCFLESFCPWMDVKKTEKAQTSRTFQLDQQQKECCFHHASLLLGPHSSSVSQLYPSGQTPLYTNEQALPSSWWASCFFVFFFFGSYLFPTLKPSCLDGADPYSRPKKNPWQPWQLIQTWTQPIQLKSVILKSCLGLCSISGEGVQLVWWDLVAILANTWREPWARSILEMKPLSGMRDTKAR